MIIVNIKTTLKNIKENERNENEDKRWRHSAKAIYFHALLYLITFMSQSKSTAERMTALYKTRYVCW